MEKQLQKGRGKLLDRAQNFMVSARMSRVEELGLRGLRNYGYGVPGSVLAGLSFQKLSFCGSWGSGFLVWSLPRFRRLHRSAFRTLRNTYALGMGCSILSTTAKRVPLNSTSQNPKH